MLKENIIKLAKVKNELCISIYLPNSHNGAHANRQRLKEQMFEAEQILLELGTDPLKTARILVPIAALTDDTDFWKNRPEGFAAFLTTESFVWFPFPDAIRELVIVSDRFHLKPLIGNALRNKGFYLLNLSEKQIRFFEGTDFGVNEIFLRGMPRCFNQFHLSLEVEMQRPKYAFQTGISTISLPKTFEVNQKLKVVEIFRKLEKMVSSFLKNEDKPLILAGAKSLQLIYRSLNTYSGLSERVIKSYVDQFSSVEMLETILPAVKSHSQKKLKLALKSFNEHRVLGLTSQNLREVFTASVESRIATLFIPETEQIWGKFKENAKQLEIHQTRQAGDQDLLNTVALNTLLNSGKVFVLTPQEMPDQSSVSAIFRI